MHLNFRPSLSDEKGMMITQVVIVAGVLLAVLLLGYETVQISIKSANTAASAAAFNNLILSVKQALAVTPTCADSLGIRGFSMGIISGASGGYDIPAVTRLPKLGLKPAVTVEPANAAVKGAAEFRVTSVKLRNVRSVGHHSGGALTTLPMGTYSADLEIVAERRFGFLGGSTMRDSIPVILGTSFPAIGGEVIRECSVKSNIALELGPQTLPAGIPRKVALDCVDRGGSPVLAPGETWYVCRLPISSFAVCDPAKGQTNIPGWYCYQSTQVDKITNTGFTYAY